ncbi:MAG: 2-C-methyl-D-erythritol 4-phosphate cytidylyltransferase, partial [Oscillospiraceae bacterium]|nr:2-C-methyl-D-erythritol 4-phosphate cytidylyltransferase [Oscillospiraceae bacterium]
SIVWCLRRFEEAPSVSEVVVVARTDLVPEVARLCQDHGLTKVVKVIRGGEDRTQSARLGTLECSPKAKLIAIHDGARPFVTVRVIEDAVAQAARSGAAAPAVPVKDTIKEVRDGLVERTLDRSALYAVQTPQVFDGDLIRAALQKALDDAARLTDDCAAVERLGMKVVLTRGDERNIKLTTPADLLIGEVLAEEAAP